MAPDKIYMTPSVGEPDSVLLASFSINHLDYHNDICYIRKDALLEKLSRAKELRLKSGAKESSNGIRVIDALIKMINEM